MNKHHIEKKKYDKIINNKKLLLSCILKRPAGLRDGFNEAPTQIHTSMTGTLNIDPYGIKFYTGHYLHKKNETL